MQQQLTHIDEAAKALNISTSTLYRLAREGKIPHLRVGKRYLFQVDKIIEIMLQNQRSHIPVPPKRTAQPQPTQSKPPLPGLVQPSMNSLTKRLVDAAEALELVAKQLETMRRYNIMPRGEQKQEDQPQPQSWT